MSVLRCPKCGNTDTFIVEAYSNVEVDGETGYVEEHDGFLWGDDSPCTCGSCDYGGTYDEFEVDKED